MLNLDEILQALRLELERVNQVIATMEAVSLNPTPKRRRGRKSMGHEERVAVSHRMKRYWANKRRAGEEWKAG